MSLTLDCQLSICLQLGEVEVLNENSSCECVLIFTMMNHTQRQLPLKLDLYLPPRMASRVGGRVSAALTAELMLSAYSFLWSRRVWCPYYNCSPDIISADYTGK